MNEWFGEKSTQLDISGLTAFGIPVSTRYGRSGEMVEMVEFAEALAKERLEGYVKNVFYDSKADICDIEFTDSRLQGTPVDDAMLAAAKKTISQFTWHGIVQHGRSFGG
ncbi:hypothetical protein ACVC7V_17285 [Hydrogenophaga sp. A37]|uniref:hypothetical protein n=1 Tax=Hydrogenophaga sp. A37 TaxID=1945864 RepID=UPI00098593B0|nr:hypothetical protein [Hydrogenophaga sp. A37]OOG79209.1 hypothetical protein B0E41_25645 [Hydrogenophaga sp. A37]